LDVVQVSRILGHASVSTTLDVYAHLCRSTIQVAGERVAQVVKPQAAALVIGSGDASGAGERASLHGARSP
jgi:hypothetical protein